MTIVMTIIIMVAFMSIQRNAAGQTHNQLQSECWKWACKAYHPFIYRRLITIPNDMHAGNIARWKQYEALGVTPGVWDSCLNWFEQILMYDESGPFAKRTIPATHWFEFKVGTDELSNAQKKFRTTMLPLGHKFYVVSEEEEFRTILISIVEPTLHIAKQIWKEGE